MTNISIPRHADLACWMREKENLWKEVTFTEWSIKETQELETFLLDFTGFQVGDGFMFNGKVDQNRREITNNSRTMPSRRAVHS